MKLRDKQTTCGNKNPPEDYGSQHSVKKNLVMQMFRNSEVTENENKKKHVIYRELFFSNVGGYKLVRHFFSFIQGDEKCKRCRHKNPEQNLQQRPLRSDFMSAFLKYS